MPIGFSEFLLSLRADAAQVALVGFDPVETRLRVPRARRPWFHLVLAGECAVTMLEDGAETRLRAGDFALFMNGLGHDLGTPEAEPRSLRIDALPVEEEVARLDIGKPALAMLSGSFGLEQLRDETLPGAFPPVLVNPVGALALLGGLFTKEGRASLAAQAQGPGGRAFAAALIRLIYVETVRRQFERLSRSDPGNLRRLGISQIAAARRLLHADPGHAWTLEGMARSVGMSRSVFARRFREVVGETPQHYLAGVRFAQATHLIESGATVTEASAHVGYVSASAFARAYARHIGHPPSRAPDRVADS
ncbi:MAG: AraC family transcriptional regulator [Novosphingobium sp.]